MSATYEILNTSVPLLLLTFIDGSSSVRTKGLSETFSMNKEKCTTSSGVYFSLSLPSTRRTPSYAGAVTLNMIGSIYGSTQLALMPSSSDLPAIGSSAIETMTAPEKL